jgi:L-lactate permease
VSNFHGPWLVDLASALVSMIALVALLRVWRPPRSMLEVGSWKLNVEPRTADVLLPAALNVQRPTFNVQRSSIV